MRVCILTSAPFPPEEGIGHHVWNLAGQLTARGHEVGIITRGTARPTEVEHVDGVTIWRVPFAPLYPFHVHLHGIFVNRLLRQIEDRFDVINVHTPLPPVVNTHLNKVTTVHSPMVADSAATRIDSLRTLALRLQTPVSRWIEENLFQRSAMITAVARWVGEELAQYGVPPADVIITGNGVEDGFLQAEIPPRREPYVLTVGRLQMGKGLSDLIEAARILVAARPETNLRFVVVGKGPLLDQLTRQAEQAGVMDRFEFVGHFGPEQRDELIELYSCASAFVLPSHHEGMPTVLLEAMACGLPSVSTAVGGALEVLTDGENGLLVPVEAPEALAAALLRILDDPAAAEEMGRRARATVEAQYGWRAVSERYLACFQQVFTGRMVTQ